MADFLPLKLNFFNGSGTCLSLVDFFFFEDERKHAHQDCGASVDITTNFFITIPVSPRCYFYEDRVLSADFFPQLSYRGGHSWDPSTYYSPPIRMVAVDGEGERSRRMMSFIYVFLFSVEAVIR